jgi:hypothetical protein
MVEPAPESEREALKLYGNESVALLIQHDFYPEEALKQAIRFVETHPDSMYTPHIRDGLLWGLRDKVQRQKATKAEIELYETLRKK